MVLNSFGVFVSDCWQEIPHHHKNVELDEFIVMPNHIHGIIRIIGAKKLPLAGFPGEVRRRKTLSEVHPRSGSLGAIVGSFKSVITSGSQRYVPSFGWQPRFHDRIIRGLNSLKAVRQYIRDNPANWEKDSEFVRPVLRRGSATSLR